MRILAPLERASQSPIRADSAPLGPLSQRAFRPVRRTFRPSSCPLLLES